MANQYEGWQYAYSFDLGSAVSSGDQILVTVQYQNSEGIAMQSDFSDIRFSDGTNKLLYWIIPGYTVSEDSCKVVVKLASSATTLYLHWGNEEATSESSVLACSAGYIFDGESLETGWSGSGATEADGSVTVTGVNTISTPSVTFARGYEMITRLQANTGGSAVGFGTAAPWILININPSAGYFQLGTQISSVTFVNTESAFNPIVYHNFRLQYKATAVLYADDYDPVSTSSNVPDSTLPLAILGDTTGASISVQYLAVRKFPAAGDPSITWGTIIDYFQIPPVADFTATPRTGTAPLQVEFTDTSANIPISWSWDFGDGHTSTLQNPIHTYSAEGTYTVSLTATNGNGSDAEVKTSYISVQATGLAPVAAFSGSPLASPAPLAVQFTDASTGSPSGWSWDFGDGSDNSDLQNPFHTYTEEGQYDVKLVVTNEYGTNTLTKVEYITATFPVSTAYPVRTSPFMHPKGGTRSQPFNIISSDGALMSTCTNAIISCSVNGATETTESWTISAYNSTMMRYLISVVDPGTWLEGDNIEISISCDEGLGYLALYIPSANEASSLTVNQIASGVWANSARTLTAVPSGAALSSDLSTDYANIISAISALNDVSTTEIGSMTVEGSLNLLQTLRILLAGAAGTTVISGTTANFKSVDGTKNRITATLADAGRSVTSRDGS
jgi:PKD repeat protein